MATAPIDENLRLEPVDLGLHEPLQEPTDILLSQVHLSDELR